jgi:hypothetical protein
MSSRYRREGTTLMMLEFPSIWKTSKFCALFKKKWETYCKRAANPPTVACIGLLVPSTVESNVTKIELTGL